VEQIVADVLQAQTTETPRETPLPVRQLSGGKEVRKERTTMGSKFLNLANWRKKEEGHQGNENAAEAVANPMSHPGLAKNGVHATVASAVAPKSVASAAVEKRGEEFQVELLPMEDIYRASGIVNPRRGYSVTKVVEMLHSEHLRGLSKEMKRASVLMALDAAGVSIEDVLRDAKVRQEAIDSYEATQRKQFEAMWAQKAEENAKINAELERVKASYAEKIKRNEDGVAREKSTFVTWLTSKQQEAQDMDEAVELCRKPAADPMPTSSNRPAAVQSPATMEELVSVGANVKVKVV
jgi:hypothetical protein